jgi:large subunit ribosomal protein L13
VDRPQLAATPPQSLREDPLRTFTPKPSDINRAWHVIDAEGQVLGKVATEAANLLRGKHKPIWAPHVDTGDHVIVVNAAKLDLSPRKLADKQYHRHSGYPGGLSTESLEHLLARDPERVVRLAIRGMLPKNRLGRAQLRKLRVYAGPAHPHAAQQPQPRALASKK